jgi:hypothetical protein
VMNRIGGNVSIEDIELPRVPDVLDVITDDSFVLQPHGASLLP